MGSDISHPTAGSKFAIHPDTRIGHVHLRVSDISSSLSFYKGLLGFRVIEGIEEGTFLLSPDGNPPHRIALSEAKLKDPLRGRRAGLYHFAVLLPEKKHLATILKHLLKHVDDLYFEGGSDHLVSEAIYIRDPEMNGVEIYRDKDRSEWTRVGGRLVMATRPLDTDGLLREAIQSGWETMPSRTTIGHVHLHSSDIEKSRDFYSGTLGFTLTSIYPGAYFFAAGGYHHHIASNSWLSAEILPAIEGGPGLDHFGIRLPDEKAFDKVLLRLEEMDIEVDDYEDEEFPRSAFLRDPDNIGIQLYVE